MSYLNSKLREGIHISIATQATLGGVFGEWIGLEKTLKTFCSGKGLEQKNFTCALRILPILIN